MLLQYFKHSEKSISSQFLMQAAPENQEVFTKMPYLQTQTWNIIFSYSFQGKKIATIKKKLFWDLFIKYWRMTLKDY